MRLKKQCYSGTNSLCRADLWRLREKWRVFFLVNLMWRCGGICKVLSCKSSFGLAAEMWSFSPVELKLVLNWESLFTSFQFILKHFFHLTYSSCIFFRFFLLILFLKLLCRTFDYKWLRFPIQIYTEKIHSRKMFPSGHWLKMKSLVFLVWVVGLLGSRRKDPPLIRQ